MAPEVLTAEVPLTPIHTFHRGSDLQRRYRELLDTALEAPVAIVDTADRQLAVTEWGRFAFSEGVVRIMDAIAQFHAVYENHSDEPPSKWAAMTPFPFLAVFDSEDVAEFADEQIPCLEHCLRKRNLTEYFGNLRGWVSSAETYNDEEMLAQMYEPDEPAPAKEEADDTK